MNARRGAAGMRGLAIVLAGLAVLTLQPACEALVDFDGFDYGGAPVGMGGGAGALIGGAGMTGGDATGGVTSAGGASSSVGGVSVGGQPSTTSGGEGACSVIPPSGNCNTEPGCDTCAGICIVRCPGPNCTTDLVNCPDGYACNVQCIGPDACADKTIRCPSEHDCTVSCADDRSCQNANVVCPASAPCEVACSNRPDNCLGTEVQCGPKDCVAMCLDHRQGPSLTCKNSGCACSPCGAAGG